MDSEKHLIDQLKHRIRSQQQEITKLTEEIKSTKRAYRQLEKAFYLAPGHVYWKDKNGVYQACNDQQAITLGYQSGKDIVGKTDYDLPWSDRGDFLHQVDTGVMENQAEYVVEEPLPIGGGKEALFLSRKVPMYDETGQVSGIIGISFDISKEKQAEALKLQNELAKRLIQQLKTIAASLSHEIRTPLAGVRLGLKSLKMFFESLISERKRLLSLVEQEEFAITVDDLKEKQAYLDKLVDRIDEGNAVITLQLKNMVLEQVDTRQFKPCSIKRCLRDALDNFPFKYEEEKKLIHIEETQPFSFWGDPLLTKHVVWNLLNNALHFIRESDKGEIFIRVEQHEEQNVIYFKDTAKGMSEETVRRIFEQFYTKRNGGSGLGLNFCKLVMEAYGGSITCQAKENEFAEFILSFPKNYDNKILESFQNFV